MPDPTELFRSQPGWVVVAVVLIVSAAWVLRARLTQPARDDEPEPDVPAALADSVPAQRGGPGQTYDALQAALDALAETARREATRGDEAERESEQLRRRLRRALADLAECERAAADPIREAYRYAARRDPRAADTRRRHRLPEPERYLDGDTDPYGWDALAPR